MAVILDLLDGVRQTGPHSWVAKCPAHEDRTPSLSIREHDDGRWLIHCFSGCGAHDVVAAVGLDLADLFPKPLYHYAKPSPVRITAADALRCLAREAGVVAVACADLADGKAPSAEDANRLALACGRISDALEQTHG